MTELRHREANINTERGYDNSPRCHDDDHDDDITSVCVVCG